MQVNVHYAKTNLSKLLELVEEGEAVVICRSGQPVARLVPARAGRLELGAGRGETITAGDAWWQPMSDAEVREFFDGR